MNILRKRAQKVKKKTITILHFMTTFHNVAFKIETSFRNEFQATKVFNPIMKIR